MKKDDYMEFIKKYLRNRKFRSKIDKNQFIYLDGLIIQNNKKYIIEREDGSGITLSEKGEKEILNITVGTIRSRRESKERLLRYYNRLFETKTLAAIANSTEYVCEESVEYETAKKEHKPKKYIDEITFEENKDITEEEMYLKNIELFSHLYRGTKDDKTFSEVVYNILDEKNMKPSECYNEAGVNRNILSKMKNDKDYTPVKPLCVSICFGLGLNINDTENLLKIGGYALGNNTFDRVCRCMISIGMYDVLTTNEFLEYFGCDIRLGSKGLV